MTALRTWETTASKKEIEKAIHNFYPDLSDHYFQLPPHHVMEDGHVIPEVLFSKVRHVTISVKNRTSPGLDRIKSDHLINQSPVLQHTGEALHSLSVGMQSS
ncbi:hypothetical protein RB195_002216 [Necator americanus]|uniref:Uncharacterized protein n=1 Tax=Necator americanus TaxID=51031 RepID=A0ABR1DHZ8_NECAM